MKNNYTGNTSGIPKDEILLARKAQTVDPLEDILRSEVNRRAFLARMGAAGLGAAAAALLAGCGSSSRTTTANIGTVVSDPTNFPGIIGRTEDEVVLNYALTLEILEADLYRQALNLASGRSLSAPLSANAPASPTSTGDYTLTIGTGSLTSAQAQLGFLYLAQYAYVEAAHRDFLMTAISAQGGTPVSANPKGYTAPFGSDLSTILGLLYAVEETGVRAYLGAAGFMSDAAVTNGLLATAVAIHSTEARHSAAIAYTLGKDAGPVYSISGVPTGLRVTDGAAAPYASPLHENTFQYYTLPKDVLAAVAPFIVS